MVRELNYEAFLEHLAEKTKLLRNILRRKSNWIEYILRTNCLLPEAIEGQMTKKKRIRKKKNIVGP